MIPPTEQTEEISRRVREVRSCAVCGQPLIAAPKLRCGHGGKPFRLRCFTYVRASKWYAECGDSEEEAIAKLQEAMYEYLRLAFEGDPQGLVLRPSPLSHRLRYHLHRLAERLGSHGGHFMPYVADIPYLTEPQPRPKQFSMSPR